MSLGATTDIDDPFFCDLAADATRSSDDRIRSQDILCRLSTAAGTYDEDTSYGILLSDLVRASLSTDALARIPSAIAAQIELDDQVASVIVTPVVTRRPDKTVALTLSILITPADGSPELAITASP